MEKKTKRKAFSFLRSYFDVLNELKTSEEKLSFLMAIINKQFLNQDPKGLSFIVNLCYTSQKHAIESSVKGWERATNDTLSTPLPTTLPTPLQEEEEEEEEEEEVKEKDKKFLVFWDTYDKKVDKEKAYKKFMKLSYTDIDKVLTHVPKYVKSNTNKQYRKNPTTYLNGKCWNDEILITNETKKQTIDELSRHIIQEQRSRSIQTTTNNKISYSGNA